MCVWDEFWDHFASMNTVVDDFFKEAADPEDLKKILGGWQ